MPQCRLEILQPPTEAKTKTRASLVAKPAGEKNTDLTCCFFGVEESRLIIGRERLDIICYPPMLYV